MKRSEIAALLDEAEKNIAARIHTMLFVETPDSKLMLSLRSAAREMRETCKWTLRSQDSEGVNWYRAGCFGADMIKFGNVCPECGRTVEVIQ